MLHITPGERAALLLLTEGRGRRELADSLDVSEPEVDARLMALFGRMGVETEREAAAECVKRGLLQPNRMEKGGFVGRATWSDNG